MVFVFNDDRGCKALRTYMRKGFILVWVLLSTTNLFSCRKQEDTLTFMVGGASNEIEYWEELIREFEIKSGTAVRMIRQPTDSDQRRQGILLPLISKQRDPDLFLMDVVWIGQFVASGWLEPLDGYIQESNFSLDPFFQGVVNFADRYQDTLYALPIYVDGGLLYYRKDLLAQYGYEAPPKTWDELQEYSKKILKEERMNNPDFYGFVWQGAQYEGVVCTFLEFAASNGGGIVLEGRIQLDHPKNSEALKFMGDLIHQNQISPPNTFTEMKEEEVRRSFERGDALFERNWTYAWILHDREESSVKGKVGIAPLPHFGGGESVSTLGGWHIGISKYSDVKEKAWELLLFLTSYEVEKKLVLHLGWNPGRKDVYEDPEVLRALPHLHHLKGIFENAVARPNLPYYTQLSEVIQRGVNGSLSGEVKPEEALKQMQLEARKVRKMYREK